ncbi:DNA polymerase III subunit gamma/tau [Dechloromonas sp. ZY10]|uniref:DNA polymerase III subunit gamma/tau n=1 Tax=Dechloromonas aquae TaxID=2664436 RepID=UPI00352705DD
MSYQVLARKWRPRNFSTLVGQEHVVRALTHALTEQRLHHAYLFTGTRGVGKTTLARILAKSLNCERGITSEPCGQCSACLEIDAGRFVDLLEVDAATNTRVDEMRQLLENAVYAPTRGRFKVYVIDEVHMLSTSAFNAMLKTLEEPPEHVKFILATTDPQKIPVTVLSRCLQFNLKQMPPPAICGHLSHVLQAEGVPFEAAALAQIAHAAAGSMRDALSLLDQAIAHGAGAVYDGQVRAMLGTVDQDHLFALLEAVRLGDASELLRVAADMSVRSLSFASALQALAGLLTQIQVAQCAPAAIAEDEPGRDRLLALAAGFSPEFVQLAYQIAIVGRSELGLAPDEYSGFVMTLLRLHSFRPSSVADVVAAVAPRAKSLVRSPIAPGGQMAVRGESEMAPSRAVVVELTVANSTEAAGGGVVDWRRVVAELPISGLARELAQNCELRQLDDALCLLRLPPERGHLQMKASQDKLQQALAAYFGRNLALRIEVKQIDGDTPAAQAGREREQRQQQACAAIDRDPFVREMLESCDAVLDKETIKPVG